MADPIAEKADRKILAITRYNYDGEMLTESQMLKKAKSKEAVFMSSDKKPTYHAVMPNGQVFKISESSFKKSPLKDGTSTQTKEKLVNLAANKLNVRDSVDYNLWAKGKSTDQKLEWFQKKTAGVVVADKVAHEYLHRLGTPTRVAARFFKKEAAGYAIGPGGLESTESGITLQKGAMYGLGASSSPSLVILTDVSDTKVKYLNYPFDGSPLGMEAWIAKDLLAKGTRTYLRGRGSYIDKKLKSSMESLLKGGKGISENMNDWKQVTIQAVSSEPGKDEWRAAEEYGNVGGLDDPEHGQIYEIEAFNSEVPKIKKDKRLKVLKVVNR